MKIARRALPRIVTQFKSAALERMLSARRSYPMGGTFVITETAPVLPNQITEAPLFVKQLIPKNGRINFQDASIRWDMYLRSDLKYYDDLLAGNVCYKRFSRRIEIVLERGEEQQILDSIGIDSEGRLLREAAGKPILMRKRGANSTPVNLFNDGRLYAQMFWVFSEVNTFVKKLSQPKGKAPPCFQFGNVRFKCSNDSRLVLWDAINSGRLVFECNRKGIYAFIWGVESEELEFIGCIRFDAYGKPRRGIKAYRVGGRMVSIFAKSQPDVRLQDFIPVLGVKDIPVSVFWNRERSRFHASVRHQGVRFSFSVNRRSELYPDLAAMRVFLRVGIPGQVDVVAKKDGKTTHVGSFQYADDGTLLDQQGKPFMRGGEPLKFDRERKTAPNVAISDLIPATFSVVGKVGLYKGPFARFTVNNVSYNFSCDPRGKYWQALSEGRLFYRHQAHKIVVFELRDKEEWEVGTFRLDAQGMPLTAEAEPFFATLPTGSLQASLSDLIPAAAVLRVPVRLRIMKRGRRAKVREVFVMKHRDFRLGLEMTNQALLYRQACLAGMVFVEIDGQKIAVLCQNPDGSEFVLGKSSFDACATTHTSLARLIPALRLQDKDVAVASYFDEVQAFLDQRNFQEARNSLYKILHFFPEDGIILAQLGYVDFMENGGKFEDAGVFLDNGADENGNGKGQQLRTALASGYDEMVPMLEGKPYHVLPLLFGLAVDSDEAHLVRANAIFMIGELGALLVKPGKRKAHQKPTSVMLEAVLHKLGRLIGRSHMGPFRDVALVAYQKSMGIVSEPIVATTSFVDHIY